MRHITGRGTTKLTNLITKTATSQIDRLLDRLHGPLLPVMPAFGEDESLDLDATTRWVDHLIGAGIRLFWTTFGTSHYLSMGDRDVYDMTAAIGAVTHGRAVFIASTQFTWSTGQCIEFAKYAAKHGVDVVKVQIDWRYRPDEDVVFERYRAIAAGSPIPLISYALGQGTFGATAGGPSRDMFRRLLEIPELIGMKNDAGDFYEQTAFQAQVRESGRRFEVITGGAMEPHLHAHRFGQRAYAVALAMLAPSIALAFDRAVQAGDDETAIRIVRDIEEPFIRACRPMGLWAALHEGLRIQGWFPARTVRFPLRTITDAEAVEIRKTMDRLGLIAAI